MIASNSDLIVNKMNNFFITETIAREYKNATNAIKEASQPPKKKVTFIHRIFTFYIENIYYLLHLFTKMPYTILISQNNR